jgi:hypothetical protein
MKPKEALVKDGFVEGGHTWSSGDENKRGRMSKAANERCGELATAGWQIDGFTVGKPDSVTGVSEVVKVKTDPNAVVDIPNPTRDEKAMEAYSGTVKVGMRTVCNNCRRSLTYCPCESPRVWLDHDTQGVVYFKVKA